MEGSALIGDVHARTASVPVPSGGITRGTGVDRSGNVVTSGVPFGIAVDSSSNERARVTVVRKGFCAVLTADDSPSQDAGAKVTTDGKFIDDADTGSTTVIPEMDAGSADELIDAYVDCLNVNNA